MKNLLTLLFLYLVTLSNAQINLENINLNDYKQVDFKYRSMGLYFDIKGDATGEYEKRHSTETYVGKSDNELHLKIDFTFIKNSRKKQMARWTDFVTNPRVSAERDVNEIDKIELKFINQFVFNQRVKYYVFSKLFFENDMSIWALNNQTKVIDLEKSRSYSFIVDIPLLIGFGRVENVTSAWHAFRIIEDLSKNNLLSSGSNFNREDIVGIADYITKKRYTRSFDYRLKKQESIIGLSETFLNGKADICNPRLYASLYDMWNNGVNTIRRSGSTISIGIVPKINVFTDNVFYNDRVSKRLDLYAITRLEYYRALGMKWQLDFELNLKAGAKDVFDFGDGFVNEIPFLGGSFNLGVGYYPNSRTSFSSNLYLSGFTRGGDVAFDGSTYSYFSFINSVYYYISPQLRLQLKFNIGNRTNAFEGDEFIKSKAKISYGLSFNYYIF